MADDPYSVLGLPRDSTEEQVRAARRRLATASHPDVGGDHSRMAAINRAHDEIIAMLVRSTVSGDFETSPSTGEPRKDARRKSRVVGVDRPSFVIEALPVVAFEILLLAGRSLGDIADEDPPYLLEVLLEDPPMTWCRLELAPDAGSTTVSLFSDSNCDIEEIRDLWIASVNELDPAGFTD